MMRALLLAAGKATRLGELREQYAKACVPIAGTTPLRFAIDALTRAGVQHFIVNLHWQAEQVRAEAQAAVPKHARLDFVEEPQLLGTGGTLLACVDQLGLFPDLILNAKQFGDLDWPAILASAPGTLVLHQQSPLELFGGLAYGSDGELCGLVARESPIQLPVDAQDAAVYTGVCRPHRSWLPLLREHAAQRPDEPLCLARSGFLAAHQTGQRVPTLLHAGRWCEISTPERVQEAASLVGSLTAEPSSQTGFGVS